MNVLYSNLAYLTLLLPLGVVSFLIFLLSVRKPWGQTARRIVGNGCLVGFLTVVIILACVVYLVFLQDPSMILGPDP